MDEQEMRMDFLNARAINALVCALSWGAFNRVCNCELAKEIWDILEVIHEGIKQIKSLKSASLPPL